MPKLKREKKNTKDSLSAFRHTLEQKEQIQSLAEKYGVSFSEWVLMAALKWRPAKSDLEEDV